VIVRGGSDGDGGSAAAGKGDGGDGRERARSGDAWTGSVIVPLSRVPGCATLAAQARVALLSPVAGIVGAGCRCRHGAGRVPVPGAGAGWVRTETTAGWRIVFYVLSATRRPIL
jgi:hypothetical protein